MPELIRRDNVGKWCVIEPLYMRVRYQDPKQPNKTMIAGPKPFANEVNIVANLGAGKYSMRYYGEDTKGEDVFIMETEAVELQLGDVLYMVFKPRIV